MESLMVEASFAGVQARERVHAFLHKRAAKVAYVKQVK
jgi:hypothetical protein